MSQNILPEGPADVLTDVVKLLKKHSSADVRAALRVVGPASSFAPLLNSMIAIGQLAAAVGGAKQPNGAKDRSIQQQLDAFLATDTDGSRPRSESAEHQDQPDPAHSPNSADSTDVDEPDDSISHRPGDLPPSIPAEDFRPLRDAVATVVAANKDSFPDGHAIAALPILWGGHVIEVRRDSRLRLAKRALKSLNRSGFGAPMVRNYLAEVKRRARQVGPAETASQFTRAIR